MLLSEVINGYADRLARTNLRVARRSWPAFRACGLAGLLLAVASGLVVAKFAGLSVWVVSALAVVSALTFLCLALVAKAIRGEERLVYYHQQVAVLAVAAIVLWSFGLPVLPYLDVTVLGVGLFLACGRVGCLMVGCCHGRPSRWGVRYRPEHVREGFAPHFIGVRLFPVQAVEAVCVFCICVAGAAFVLSSRPPGEALALYVVAYGLVRFSLEFARGDAERPYLLEFSEAQWTSLALMSATVWAELSGLVPYHPWHAAATASVLALLLAAAVVRKLHPTHKLLHARHVNEVAAAIALLEATARGGGAHAADAESLATLPTACTSLGIKLSASSYSSAAGLTQHFAISSAQGGLTPAAAKVLARLILRLVAAACDSQFVAGRFGVFHLLIYPERREHEGHFSQLSTTTPESEHAI